MIIAEEYIDIRQVAAAWIREEGEGSGLEIVYVLSGSTYCIGGISKRDWMRFRSALENKYGRRGFAPSV